LSTAEVFCILKNYAIQLYHNNVIQNAMLN
jgi:hypothetical protein